jgi:hypothetical protein
MKWEGIDWPFEVYFWGRKVMVEFGFEEGEVKGFTTSGEGTVCDISLSACGIQFLRLRLKKKRARRRKMRTSPPITPPMIASVGVLWLPVGVEELGEELDEVPDGTPVEVVKDVEDVSSSWIK